VLKLGVWSSEWSSPVPVDFVGSYVCYGPRVANIANGNGIWHRVSTHQTVSNDWTFLAYLTDTYYSNARGLFH
jgi:hypothetical protein